MKDEALRASILITAGAYQARGDQAGNLIFAALDAILEGAKIMDEALAVTPVKGRKSSTVSRPTQNSEAK